MPFDAYSLCPGGSGKKIKFCCPDFFPELEKIENLLSGGQFAACVEHIERVQSRPDNQDRACLMAMKADALLELGRADEGFANAQAWVEKHPDNGDANAEIAVHLGVSQGVKAAMPYLQKAIAICKNEISVRLLNALTVVVQAAQYQQEWLPVGPLTNLLMDIQPDRPEWARLRATFTHNAQAPLPLRQTPTFHVLPEDTPEKSRLHAALVKLADCSWQEALKDFESLLADVPDMPVLWRAIAYARGYLVDNAGCCEALKKYATLEVPLDDAVDAWLLALSLSENPLGDSDELANCSWEIGDCDRLWEQILSSDRAMVVPAERFRVEGGAMPRGAFVLFDRPSQEASAEVTLQTVQRLIGAGVLYGRQTDRAARLEFTGLSDEDAAMVRAWVDQIAPGVVQGEPVRQVVGMMSKSVRMAHANFRLPEDWGKLQYREFMAQYLREQFLQQWPQMKLGLFGGRSLAEAAAVPENRIAALAVIGYLQESLEMQGLEFDFNPLRANLGLPQAEPIEPEHAEEAFENLTRLSRLKPEGLSDAALDAALRLAYLYDLATSMLKFAKELASRPSFDNTPSQQRALQILAQSADTADEALGYLEKGRKSAEAAGQPSGQWHLMELAQLMQAGQGVRAQEVFEHVYRQHAKEPGVAEALTRFLVEMGAIRPDGTPNPEFHSGAAAPPAAESSGLWTPESQQPSSGGGKLWTPD